MSVQSQFDREEEHIIEMMNSGQISQADGRQQLRDLQREYREMAQESARVAYERELDQW